MKKEKSKNKAIHEAQACVDLGEIRAKIDNINEQIVELVAERMRLAELVLNEKRKAGISVRNTEREEQIIKSMREKATRLNLDSDFIEDVFRKIIAYTVSWEMRNYGGKKE